MKSTLFWPKKKKRKKKHGFLVRSRSRYGKTVLSRRRQKSRKRLTVWNIDVSTYRYFDISILALPKKNRLSKRRDIDKVFKNGMTVRGGFLLAKFLGNHKDYPRFAFIIPSKRVQLAVNRNRAKRVQSELTRSYLDLGGKDVVVIVYKKLDKNHIDGLAVDLKNILNKITWQE